MQSRGFLKNDTFVNSNFYPGPDMALNEVALYSLFDGETALLWLEHDF